LTTVFGDPITYDEYKDLSLDDLRSMVRVKIANLIGVEP